MITNSVDGPFLQAKPFRYHHLTPPHLRLDPFPVLYLKSEG